MTTPKPQHALVGLRDDGEERLAARGILDAATAAGWHSFTWSMTLGWAYPLYRADGMKWALPDGRPAQRWKAYDSAHKPKYLWGYPGQGKGEVKHPDGCAFYWLPGGDIRRQVADYQGLLWLACGEPDMLTLAAAGYRNVTSFFGEGNAPANAPDLLRSLGVTLVHYYPDNDNTGWDDAERLYALFAGTGVEFQAFGLPDSYDGVAINDLNDLWVACRFDRTAFITATGDCKPLTFLTARAEPDTGDELWKERLKAHYEAVERALGAKWDTGKGGWSKPLACIFTHHHNDAKQPGAGYHREKHTFRCFKCSQTWQGDAVSERLGIAPPERPPMLPERATTPPDTAPAASRIAIHSSDDSLLRYRERLNGQNVIEPVPFPFTGLHHLGGFCRIVPLGKLIGVLGVSGGGKTSFIETLTDAWRRMGFHILWWGPEWTWEEMADRAVQRYGGATMMQMMQHELWYAEQSQDVPDAKRLGKRLPDALLAKTEAVIDEVMGWTGKAHYLDRMDVTLAELLDAAAGRLAELTAAGQRPKIAVFDYIQLAEVSGARGDGERIPRAIAGIKAFCTDNRLVGVVGTQARKEDSSEAREAGKLLTAEAAQYFRDDKTNLFITLNPEYDAEGNMTGDGKISVVKNSGGRKGAVDAKPDPMFLRWNDTRHIEFKDLNYGDKVR